MLQNLINLFFPKVCEACQQVLLEQELVVCTSCRHGLPLTEFHFNNSDVPKQVLYGRVNLEHATALLYFSKKGMVQQLLHKLKYKGHEHIGVFLGKWLGAELKTIEAYRAIDVVVPVPLHKSRLRKRGYNQVSGFGKEIAKALNAEFCDTVLIKATATKTQVFKERLKRWNSDGALFTILEEESLKGKHILLVDDIITTGATVENCATVLLRIENIKISIATMAIAN